MLREVLAGATRHAGSLLAPLAVRFVVADPKDIPKEAFRRLARQLDLNLVPAGGLLIFENAKWVPLASIVADPEWLQAAFAPTIESVAHLPAAHAEPLLRSPVSGSPDESLILLSQQYDSRWRLTLRQGAEPLHPRRAFGWAVGFVGSPGPGFAIAFGGQRVRSVEIALLAMLWLGVLWVKRKPALVV
jgi:hypothetical protein